MRQGFLPTPSHGGRPGASHHRHKQASYFYPRPHMEGDIPTCPGPMTGAPFLPTPSHGGRPMRTPTASRAGRFLPTPSHGGRRSCNFYQAHRILFLPTPSHGGRLKHAKMMMYTKRISTHALTWRATGWCALPQGRAADFYPRPHMEGDMILSFYR